MNTIHKSDIPHRAPCRRLGDVLKRASDIFLSLLCIILLLPVMTVISIFVKLEDHGTVFFRQERITKDGQIFQILKFRTMRAPDENGCSESDRVTKTGRFLRRCWLDELPQLFNILAGHMSFVGPRPESIPDVERSRAVCPDFDKRSQVRAGLTGLAQLLGRYDTPPREKLALDMLYIENRSPGFDIILMMTTFFVFCKKLFEKGENG